MTTVTRTLEADLATIPGVTGIAPRTVVALPPSDADIYGAGGYGGYAEGYAGGAEAGSDEMRVYVSGSLIRREYDPDMEQP